LACAFCSSLICAYFTLAFSAKHALHSERTPIKPRAFAAYADSGFSTLQQAQVFMAQLS
jgi:hypothetical protein